MEAGKEPILVACAADEHYVMPLAVMLTSMVERLEPRRAISVHVIDGGIQPADRRRLFEFLSRPNVSINWLPGRSRARSGLPVWGRLRPAVYERLALHEYLPSGASKVIWLDCDLVVTHDLARLWDTGMGDRHLLAVQDMIVPYVSSPMGVARHHELGLSSEQKYFNAGVMVMNLARWREDEVAARVMAYLERYREDVFFLEQEALNVVLADGWGELDPRWNQNAGVAGRSFYRPTHLDAATYERVVNDPWIVHFTGSLKPWGVCDPRSRSLYLRHLDATPWAGQRPRWGPANLLLRMYESTHLRDLAYPLERRAVQLARRVSRARSAGRSRRGDPELEAATNGK